MYFYSDLWYNNHMNKQTVKLGDVTYFGGFIANHHWVTDLKGRNVAECYSKEVAKTLAKELNKMFERGGDLE